jgi:hypothetical protein
VLFYSTIVFQYDCAPAVLDMHNRATAYDGACPNTGKEKCWDGRRFDKRNPVQGSPPLHPGIRTGKWHPCRSASGGTTW